MLTSENANVRILNGSNIAGMAGSTQEYLAGLGVNIFEVGNADDYYTRTTIYDYTGKPYTVQFLVDTMNINRAQIFNRYDPDSTVDITVVLGGDWVLP